MTDYKDLFKEASNLNKTRLYLDKQNSHCCNGLIHRQGVWPAVKEIAKVEKMPKGSYLKYARTKPKKM